VIDPSDQHEVMVRMDEHDVRMLLEQVQANALRKWVYVIEGNKLGLTIHCVRGHRAADELDRQVPDRDPAGDAEGRADRGGRWERAGAVLVATIFARDEVTGRCCRACRWSRSGCGSRRTPRTRSGAGMQIPEDNTIFDVFSQRRRCRRRPATRWPGSSRRRSEQTVIAMFSGRVVPGAADPDAAEQKVADLPPALTDDRAKEQVAKARALYDEIRELGGGRGKLDYTPGHFFAHLTAAQHDHGRLDEFVAYLEQRHAEIENKYAEGSA
jgi:heme oxygenase